MREFKEKHVATMVEHSLYDKIKSAAVAGDCSVSTFVRPALDAYFSPESTNRKMQDVIAQLQNESVRFRTTVNDAIQSLDQGD